MSTISCRSGFSPTVGLISDLHDRTVGLKPDLRHLRIEEAK